MAEKMTDIGGRLHDTSGNHIVAGANEIFDDDLGKRQSVINAEQVTINQNQDVINQSQEAINDSVDESIENLEEEVADRYTKEETNNIISRTPETDVIVINVPSESQSDIAGWLDANTPSGTDPETGRSVRANKLYRVPGPDNTTFSEWAWDGAAYIMLANKDYGIDDKPMPGSSNAVKSGTLWNILYKKQLMSSTLSEQGCFYNNGSKTTNSNYRVDKYAVEAGHEYTFSGSLSARSTVPFVSWWDANGEYISQEPYKGSMDSDVHIEDQGLVAPPDAAFLYLNVLLSRSTYYNVKSAEQINLAEMDEDVEDLTSYDFDGNPFIIPSTAIRYDNGLDFSGSVGLRATPFLPITGEDDIVLTKGWNTSATIAPLAFYDKDKNFISSIHYDENGAYDVTVPVSSIPSGARYIRCSANISYEGYHVKKGVNISSLLKEILETEDTVASIDNQISIKRPLVSSSTENDCFYNNGSKTTNSNYRVDKYVVEEGKQYTFSGLLNATSNIHFVSWWDANGEYISQEPYQGNIDYNVQFTDKMIVAPEGAAFLYLNVNKSNSAYYNVKAFEGYIDAFKLSSLSGHPFVLSGTAIRYENGIEYSVSEAICATPFLPITGKDDIVLIGGWNSSAAISPLVFYNKDRNFISSIHFGSNGNYNVTVPSRSIPSGARYIRCTANFLNELTHEIRSGIDVASLCWETSSSRDDIDMLKELSSYKNLEDMTAASSEQDCFYNNGSKTTNSNYRVDKYAVEAGHKYTFSGSLPARSTVPFVSWWDSNGEYISQEPYKGSMDNDVLFQDQILKAPSGAAYLYLNVIKSRQASYNAKSVVSVSYVNTADLKKKVDSLQSDSTKNMEVTVNGNPKAIGSTISIRTALSPEKDIVVVYERHANGNITPSRSYIGQSSLETVEIMDSNNLFHTWSDSTAPLRNSTYAPWHMFAQHGYEIPTISCTHSLTNADLNTEWTDDKNRHFLIGKISGSTISLLPVVSMTAQGAYTRSWLNHTVETPILSISKDGVTINVDSQSFTQIRPIQKSKDFSIVADGTEMDGESLFWCNDLVISETLECYNPFTVETWFPSPVGNTVAIELTQSFNIHGVAHRYDTVMNVLEPLYFRQYGANQAQCLVGPSFTGLGSIVDDYSAYVMIPKIKKTVNGKRVDMPRITESTSDDVIFNRNSSTLYDVDDQPDREITYLYDSVGDKFLAGFAAGLSLTRGLSVKERRNTFIPSGSEGGWESYSNRNKFYANILVSEYFENNILPAGFVGVFSTYYSYFNPADNKGQVYWYKDGNCYVIYAHYQDANTNIPLNLPTEIDGLQVEVVEKTNGVTLVTDSIANGKLYLTTDSSDHNYIVLKTK